VRAGEVNMKHRLAVLATLATLAGLATVLAIPSAAAASPAAPGSAAAPAATCSFQVTAYPVLCVRSGPGKNYPVKGPPIRDGTYVTGNCQPTNGFFFILDPGDNTYHWGNGQYLREV